MTRQYLDIVFEVVRDEAAMAEGFKDMITDIESHNRAQMVQTLDDLEEIGGRSLDLLLEAEPPGSLVEANLWLRVAVSSWRAGLSESRAGLVALTLNPIDQDGMAALNRGFVDLRVGDRAYQGFLSEMADVDTDLHGGPLPSVVFIPTGQEELFDPENLARRMLLTTDIGAVVDLAVADLRLDPPPLGLQAGLPVVPVADQHGAEATITNRGNIDQVGIRVSLRLVSGAGLDHEDSVVIEELAAGRSTTVRFDALPAEPGTTYELTISVPDGDVVPENDQASITFIVNADD